MSEDTGKTFIVPETFIPGQAYIAPSEDGPTLSPDQLSNVQTGPQEHVSSVGAPIVGETPQVEEDPIQKIARKYTTKHGKAKAFAVVAAVKRASKRLLMAERSKKLSCVCPISGIVTLLELPAIPGYALTYQHPLASIENCRGLAQRGADYLKQLDTQTLAGILIILADSYSLFRFQASDSGAQKNAILRTAGKDILIDAILLIEEQIHSRNAGNLPRLSLTTDVVADDKISMQTRLTGYVSMLAEAIVKPDLSVYDENEPPKRIGKIPRISDAKKAEKAEASANRKGKLIAKKQLAEDAKAAKILAENLVALGFAKAPLKIIIAQVFAESGLAFVTVDPGLIAKLVSKIEAYEHEDATKLIEILQKDRRILVDDEFLAEDDPKPGQEEAVEDTFETTIEAQAEQQAQAYFDNGTEFNHLPETLEPYAVTEEEQAKIDAEESKTPKPPAGLSKIEEILWLKKWKQSQANLKNLQNQQEIPSIATYIPSVTKQKLGDA